MPNRRTEQDNTQAAKAAGSNFEEAKRRLQEALPEIDIDRLGEKMAAVGGKHNLTEKWDAMAREFEYWIDLAKSIH